MTMTAAVYERYGPPEVLEVKEVPIPQLKEDELLIRVGATTVTAADGMMRRGDTLMSRLVLGPLRPYRRFRILGVEVAGTVERVGPAVTRFRTQDRVFGFTGFGAGGYAQYVRMKESASVAPAPPGLSHHEACTLVDGPTTALHFLRELGALKPGERIAIIGASGSVGSAAVQLARHLGADVTGICSGANADLVRSLGAHRVIDYTRDDYAALGERFDVVFDTVGKSSFAAAKRCLVAGGRYLLTVGGLATPLRSLWSRFFGSRKLVFGFSVDKRASLPEVSALVKRGVLRPVIDRRYALDGIVEAHRYVDTGRKRGNVVIAIGEE